MSKHKFAFVFIILSALTLFSYRVSFSFFESAAASNNNTFTAAAVFPSPSIFSSTSPSISPTSSPSSSPVGIPDHLVISEVQITQGSGELNNNDFIELYNPTNLQINLGPYKLVYRTSVGSIDNPIVSFSSSDIIPAHGFFLWAHKSSTNTYADNISADVSTTAILSADNSIAIKDNSGNVIDAIGFGNSGTNSLRETTDFATNPGANESIERKAYSTSDTTSMTTGGDVTHGNSFDSNDNASDFILRGTSQPQNSISSVETP